MAAKTRTRRSGTGQKVDAYQVVTDRIVEALEQGVVPWHQPWRAYGEGPMSLSTKRPYRGVNVFILGATALVRGYESPWWGTYRQISERGGQVRKGEHGTPIVFWRFIERRDAKGEVESRIPLLRYFTVFNAGQCDDLTVPASEPLAEHDPIDACERISAGYRTADGPELKHGGDRAFYAPMFDRVQMPLLGQFEEPEGYYATLFHEFGHSTGHEKRLGRKVGEPTPFGSPDYSREELVAEMTAAFVCGEAGITVNVPASAAYIRSWLRVLQEDVKAVVQAAGAAQRAADLILGRSGKPVEDAGEDA